MTMKDNQRLELWGGAECTVNRVGEHFMDQTVLSGHEARISDLDLFADLGIKAIRYPVLWERIAPEIDQAPDWRWTDKRLARLRALDIRPIAGLVHHGSGPRHTHLLDPGFATGLAAFAGAAAERYDWVQDWTPVNEPLTTARFSALYGHWYPHLRDEDACWTALLNQIDAIRLSMRAIRAVNPAARLIQTEDLGKTYSTRAVAHQASYDNQRRWMTWDLLCGKVDKDHPLFERLCRHGLRDRLAAIADDPCPPDIIGVNHYLTSDRFLDHRCERYPPERCGSNEFMAYADVEAIRVTQPAPGGMEERLEEAWARYGLPLAVTEAHLGCTREDQMRWVKQAWDDAGALRARGVDVRAVTAWSLLGAFDWDSLLTQRRGRYEPGAFDVRSGAPRPTALACLLKSLATDAPVAPAAQGAGWWRRDIRLQFHPVFRTVDAPQPRRAWSGPVSDARRPLLITGASGTLGQALARACEWRGLDYVLTDRKFLDLGDEASVERAIERLEPWAVINAAGWVRVDDAEAEEDACHLANAHGPERLARICARDGVRFASFSSDLVFDGGKGEAYVERDEPNPLNAYGRSKAAAERSVLEAGGLMVRTAAFFSPYDVHNFALQAAQTLARGQAFRAAEDLVMSPAYVPDLVDATLDLVIDGEDGLWHLANVGQASWADFARRIARALRLEQDLVRAVHSREFGWAARRPARVPLVSERGALMPTLDDAIGRYASMMFASEFEAQAQTEAGVRVRA